MLMRAMRTMCGAVLTASVLTGGGAAWAQTTAPAAASATSAADLFTVKNLIGDAVSLSNQEYPEVDKAIQRFKNGDVDGARDFLEISKEKYPKLPPTEVSLAKLHFMARNGDAGRFLLESAVNSDPKDPEAYLLLADQAFGEGRTAEADALFEKAAGIVKAFTDNPKRKRKFEIRVLAGASAVRERRQQWEEAAKLLKNWLALDPDDANAHQRFGIVLFRQGDSAGAFEQFAQARKLQPDAAHPNVLLGQLYTQDKKLDQARKAFEDAYKAEGGVEGTARAYAEWLIQQDDLAKAQEVASALRKKAPDSVAALLLDGLVAKMRGDRKGAESALTAALTIDPANASATNLLALLLVESGNVADREKALRYAQVNAQRFPQLSQAQITLAWVLFQLNRVQEGSEALTRGAQAGQLNADSAYLVARIFSQQGQKDKARLALEQVLRQTGAGAFMYRKDAEKLLKELQAAGVTPTPAPTN